MDRSILMGKRSLLGDSPGSSGSLRQQAMGEKLTHQGKGFDRKMDGCMNKKLTKKDVKIMQGLWRKNIHANESRMLTFLHTSYVYGLTFSEITIFHISTFLFSTLF